MTEKTCVICGKTFIPKRSRQQCCGSECANVKSHQTLKKGNLCQHCGKPFWRANAFRMKYCSSECLNEARKEQSLQIPKKEQVRIEKQCAWCGKEFTSHNSRQIYCCSECGYEGSKRRQREQWKLEYVSQKCICKECGTVFMTECGNKHSVFCCRTCADKHERRIEHSTERHREYMKKVKKNREQQIQNAFVEDVQYDDIYERDKGICQICGQPVLYDKHFSSNWSGSIDHIIPLSGGGEHSMKNCQLAHRVCNSLKGKQLDIIKIDWAEKSEENNYWHIRYQEFRTLCDTRPAGCRISSV